jgi:hypothetical protein
MFIYYSGIGSNKNEIHTVQEFLDVMNKEFTWKDWNNSVSWSAQLQFKDWVLPDDFIFFTLKDWIEYSGAESYDTSGSRAKVFDVDKLLSYIK